MNLIIEKDFIDEIFVMSDSNCTITADLLEFIKVDFIGYNLVCDISSYEDYQQAADENPIFELLLDNIKTIKYHPALKKEIRDNEFYTNLGHQNIFLTTLSASECRALKTDFGFIYVSSELMAETWQCAFNLRQNITYKVTKSTRMSNTSRFDNWQKLETLNHPVTSIIIFDRYLLRDIDLNNLKTNFVPLIQNLISNCPRNYKIYITVVSEANEHKRLEEYKTAIENFSRLNGISLIEVNIIRHLKALYPKNFEGLHARFIITNYCQIISDESFNYFKKNGDVRNVANISAGFALSGHYKESISKDIDDLKTYLKKVENQIRGDEKFQDAYFPSKTNPLLN